MTRMARMKTKRKEVHATAPRTRRERSEGGFEQKGAKEAE